MFNSFQALKDYNPVKFKGQEIFEVKFFTMDQLKEALEMSPETWKSSGKDTFDEALKITQDYFDTKLQRLVKRKILGLLSVNYRLFYFVSMEHIKGHGGMVLLNEVNLSGVSVVSSENLKRVSFSGGNRNKFMSVSEAVYPRDMDMRMKYSQNKYILTSSDFMERVIYHKTTTQLIDENIKFIKIEFSRMKDHQEFGSYPRESREILEKLEDVYGMIQSYNQDVDAYKADAVRRLTAKK